MNRIGSWAGPIAYRDIAGVYKLMAKDQIYREPRSSVPPFEFDENVVRVFDDMIRRSIPFYDEIISRQVQLIERYYQPETLIYDLGCSNGNLGMALCHHLADTDFGMIAIDNSIHMLDAYRSRLVEIPNRDRIRLHHQDISQTQIDNASVVVLNFTLQFLSPAERTSTVQGIYKGLCPGAILLLCEKITHAEQSLANLQQQFYIDFKRRNGYSELEISQKREALEKVLIPESVEQHLARLQSVGFRRIDVWFKWFNFAALIAVK